MKRLLIATLIIFASMIFIDQHAQLKIHQEAALEAQKGINSSLNLANDYRRQLKANIAAQKVQEEKLARVFDNLGISKHMGGE